jgi:mannose-6-phosphate isomerase
MIKEEFLSPDIAEIEVFNIIRQEMEGLGFTILVEDTSRPWGGFFVLDEGQLVKFKNLFFPELIIDDFQKEQKLSPKILIVKPHMRLSWQYHHRRKEVWKLIAGDGAIIRSFTDNEGDQNKLVLGELIALAQGERHRLIGLDKWGVVAEIWLHTDPSAPSDESDIVRVQDDFARK